MIRFAPRSVLIAALALLGACRGQPSEDPPILLLRNMWHQERYDTQSNSWFFADHRTMRTPPEGTVDREHYIADERITTGREVDNSAYLASIPEEIVDEFRGADHMVERGRDRFNIYCSPCHGRTGDGQGMVVVRSRTSGYQFPLPPTFHQDRIRHLPDGQVFATITNGVRNMPSYAAQVPVRDRWAIVSYLRALQLSQAPSPGGTP